ncbi:hypothetical protein [Methylomonas sp. AM2-LC]|uniref:hypothetical protein n=1 Tax=Methylomonas sp. AM2-LC TaxID=3153301 RepID=UPI003263F649
MLTLVKSVLVSGALIYGAANIPGVDETKPIVAFSPNHSIPDTLDHYNTNPNLELAANDFDNFAASVPGVLSARVSSVMRYGTKAVIMPDANSRLAEQQMFTQLSSAIHHVGEAIADDMAVVPHAR